MLSVDPESSTFWDRIYAPENASTMVWDATSVHFRRAVQMLPTRAHILDLGCGDGRHAVSLSLLGHHVTAVDFSRNALQRLQRAARSANTAVESHCADVMQWTPSRCYDFIICSGLLNCLSAGTQDLLISRMMAWTRRDGLNQVIAFVRLPGVSMAGVGYTVEDLDRDQLLRWYADWQRVSYHEYKLCHDHHGSSTHTHYVSNMLAARCAEWRYEVER